MENMAKVLQRTIEETYSRKFINQWVLERIDSDTDFLTELRNIGYGLLELADKYMKTAYKSKAQRWHYLVHKCPLSMFDIVTEIFVKVLQYEVTAYQAIAGMVAPKLEYPENIDAVKTVSEIMAYMAENDMFDVILPSDADTGVLMVESLYVLDDETKQKIEDTMYLPPMLCKPCEVKRNKAKQYLSFSESVILGGNVNHHNKPLALDVINILNAQQWSLDTYMLEHEEVPNKPLDTHDKRVQFEQLKRSSRKVYDLIVNHGNKFHWTHKYDKRGRVYSQGYHINLQSTDYKKSLISLAEPELVPLT